MSTRILTSSCDAFGVWGSRERLCGESSRVHLRPQRTRTRKVQCEAGSQNDEVTTSASTRRKLLAGCAMVASIVSVESNAADYEKMEALKGKDYGKPRMKYQDYTMVDSGLQYKDLVLGTGQEVGDGNKVLVDWDGYTIGYYGRPFEARNKPKGSAFEGADKDFLRVVVGSHTVIPGFEEAMYGMKVGGIRRIVVPVELGYPDNDFNKLGPKPKTFSGRRALDFVLKNQGLIDKTLLFDIEIIRILS